MNAITSPVLSMGIPGWMNPKKQSRSTCENGFVQSQSALFVMNQAHAMTTSPVDGLNLFPWGFAVFFLYCMRRVNCPTCGVKVEEVPWGTGKHTLCNAYMLHLAHWARKLSWKETAVSFHTSWDKVVQSVQYVVKWGLEHRELGTIRAIGVDEIQYGWSPIRDSGLPDRGRLHQAALDWEGANNGKLREILHPDRQRTGGEN
jgi:hypothetical protein